MQKNFRFDVTSYILVSKKNFNSTSLSWQLHCKHCKHCKHKYNNIQISGWRLYIRYLGATIWCWEAKRCLGFIYTMLLHQHGSIGGIAGRTELLSLDSSLFPLLPLFSPDLAKKSCPCMLAGKSWSQGLAIRARQQWHLQFPQVKLW